MSNSDGGVDPPTELRTLSAAEVVPSVEVLAKDLGEIDRSSARRNWARY